MARKRRKKKRRSGPDTSQVPKTPNQSSEQPLSGSSSLKNAAQVASPTPASSPPQPGTPTPASSPPQPAKEAKTSTSETTRARAPSGRTGPVPEPQTERPREESVSARRPLKKAKPKAKGTTGEIHVKEDPSRPSRASAAKSSSPRKARPADRPKSSPALAVTFGEPTSIVIDDQYQALAEALEQDESSVSLQGLPTESTKPKASESTQAAGPDASVAPSHAQPRSPDEQIDQKDTDDITAKMLKIPLAREAISKNLIKAKQARHAESEGSETSPQSTDWAAGGPTSLMARLDWDGLPIRPKKELDDTTGRFRLVHPSPFGLSPDLSDRDATTKKKQPDKGLFSGTSTATAADRESRRPGIITDIGPSGASQAKTSRGKRESAFASDSKSKFLDLVDENDLVSTTAASAAQIPDQSRNQQTKKAPASRTNVLPPPPVPAAKDKKLGTSIAKTGQMPPPPAPPVRATKDKELGTPTEKTGQMPPPPAPPVPAAKDKKPDASTEKTGQMPPPPLSMAATPDRRPVEARLVDEELLGRGTPVKEPHEPGKSPDRNATKRTATTKASRSIAGEMSVPSPKPTKPPVVHQGGGIEYIRGLESDLPPPASSGMAGEMPDLETPASKNAFSDLENAFFDKSAEHEQEDLDTFDDLFVDAPDTPSLWNWLKGKSGSTTRNAGRGRSGKNGNGTHAQKHAAAVSTKKNAQNKAVSTQQTDASNSHKSGPQATKTNNRKASNKKRPKKK